MHQSEILVSVIFQEKSGWMFVGFVWCSHCTRQMYRFWNRSSQDEGHTSKGAFTPTALVCVNETVSLICRFSLLMWFVPFGGDAEIALTVGARPLKKWHGIIWRDRVRSSWWECMHPFRKSVWENYVIKLRTSYCLGCAERQDTSLYCILHNPDPHARAHTHTHIHISHALANSGMFVHQGVFSSSNFFPFHLTLHVWVDRGDIGSLKM